MPLTSRTPSAGAVSLAVGRTNTTSTTALGTRASNTCISFCPRATTWRRSLRACMRRAAGSLRSYGLERSSGAQRRVYCGGSRELRSGALSRFVAAVVRVLGYGRITNRRGDLGHRASAGVPRIRFARLALRARGSARRTRLARQRDVRSGDGPGSGVALRNPARVRRTAADRDREHVRVRGGERHVA